jgi:hypothetical protein
MTREEWVSNFTREFLRLGSVASHERIVELAEQLWPMLSAVVPEAAARGEFELWAPQGS